MDWNYDNTWYHGSPLKLTILRQGSTITQNRRLAEVFSHKPPIVSIGDDGSITHNGTMPGYLFSIAEKIGPEDVTPHPNSSIEEGEEWLTNRDLRLAMVGPVPLTPEEMLTEQEIEELRARLGALPGMDQ